MAHGRQSPSLAARVVSCSAHPAVVTAYGQFPTHAPSFSTLDLIAELASDDSRHAGILGGSREHSTFQPAHLRDTAS